MTDDAACGQGPPPASGEGPLLWAQQGTGRLAPQETKLMSRLRGALRREGTATPPGEKSAPS